MTTHASANKQWTEEELAELVVENRFRMRGLESTRLDTFIDAAFAFVLTLLVISFDEIPSTYAEMILAVQHIPGFAASFAVLMMFWLQHRKWSRRYGLENPRTIYLSLALIFVVMVYVYPLRMIFEGMFANLTDGFLATSYRIESYFELSMIFVFYSAGFSAMSFIVHHLYRTALQNADALALNDFELRRTRVVVQVWAIAAGFGLLSIVLALTLPDAWVLIAGYMYFVLFPLMWLPSIIDRRRHQD
ncbi:MAG: TMEM175 family protein [Woeseiaceae bacterium]|nr:TMEM175 family protein [Woeseiaceae bacterium]